MFQNEILNSMEVEFKGRRGYRSLSYKVRGGKYWRHGTAHYLIQLQHQGQCFIAYLTKQIIWPLVQRTVLFCSFIIAVGLFCNNLTVANCKKKFSLEF